MITSLVSTPSIILATLILNFVVVSASVRSPLSSIKHCRLQTFDLDEAEDYLNVNSHQNTYHQIVDFEAPSIPRDVWVVVASFLVPRIRDTFKCTNRMCHSIAMEIDLKEIASIFRELFDNTTLTPSDISDHFRPYHGPIGYDDGGAKSLICQIMERRNLVMLRGHALWSPKNGYLVIRVREISDVGTPIEEVIYLLFHFRDGRFYGLLSEHHNEFWRKSIQWYSRTDVPDPKMLLRKLEMLIGGKFVYLGLSISPSIIVRSDIYDAHWCYWRFARQGPDFHCIISCIMWGIIFALVIMFLLLLKR